MARSSTIQISDLPTKNPNPPAPGAKPDHWDDAKGTGFHNPWKSFQWTTLWQRAGLFPKMLTSTPPIPKDVDVKMPIHKPTWGANGPDVGTKATAEGEEIKATWLGHACFLVEFPLRAPAVASGSPATTARGVRVLFDPVFSDRCSPSQIIGPKRFTPPPCKLEDIPEVDAVVISHNHYDHLDTNSIRTLLKRSPDRVPHFFAPLGNDDYFQSLGVPKSHRHIMDWWESKRLQVQFTSSSPSASSSTTPNASTLTVDVTCTPGQHFTGRTGFDNFKSLWAGWVVEEVPITPPAGREPVKVYFAGDTGYCTIKEEKEPEVLDETLPICPAFAEIGKKFGGFDFAMLPIGAYDPRSIMSPIHCSPRDSVRVFKDINAKKALGMHWGTWILTFEDVLEPPKRLANEAKAQGLKDGDFVTCEIGQTLFF